HERRGPVVLAWDEVEEAARHPGRGRNVVFHEFAHKLDMVDHLVDGTPRLKDRAELQRWVDVCTEAFTALRRGDGRGRPDPYGGEDPGEFFAVATEAFFDVPIALESGEPELFDVLRGFYQQDPAARARRAGAI